MSSLTTDYSKKNSLERLLFSDSDKEYEDNLEKLRVKSNETNENEETGIGNKTDNIEEKDLKMWNLIENINIKGQSDKGILLTKVKSEEKYYRFKLLTCELSKTGKPILVIPGYSSKSIHWTFGRINKFIKDGKFKDKNISTINIIFFDGLKDIVKKIGLQEFYSSDLPFQVSNHIDKVIKSQNLDNNLILIGRSAGASHALNLAENNYIDSLHLACPGYDKKTIESFNEKSRKDLVVSVYWSINDRYIDLNDEVKGLTNLIILLNRPVKSFIYTYIKDESHGKNHRIPPELIKDL